MPVIDVAPPPPVSNAPVLAPGDTALARQPGDEPEKVEAEGEEKPAKPPKSPEQKALEKAERKIAALYASRAEARERLRTLEEIQGLQSRTIDGTNGEDAGDSGNLSLSRADLDRLIEERARKLAPTIKEQADVIEQRSQSAKALREELGPERFAELTDELSDVLPAEAQLLVLETDAPKALLEYLTDPENEAEAKRIGKMSPHQQGLRIGMLAAQLKARRTRPQPSNAPAPLEPVKSQGDAGVKPLAILSDDEFAKRRRAQILARR